MSDQIGLSLAAAVEVYRSTVIGPSEIWHRCMHHLGQLTQPPSSHPVRLVQSTTATSQTQGQDDLSLLKIAIYHVECWPFLLNLIHN